VSTETKDRIKELTTALEGKRADLKRFTAADGPIKVEGANVAVNPDDVKALRGLVAECEEIKGLIATLESADGISGFLDAEPGTGTGAAGEEAALEAKAARLREDAARRRLTLGEMFTESKEFKHYNEDGRPQAGMSQYKVEMANIGRLWLPRGAVEAKALLDNLERKDVYTAAGGTYTVNAFGSVQDDGLIIPAYRTQRVRDLFPTEQTTASQIEYVRRTGYTNNARTVAERTAADGTAATGLTTDVFGLKPPSNLTFTTEQAPIRVIAHTIDVSKTVLDDEPRLQGVINGEMLYGLRLAEDAEILFGDGTGSHILGIMNTNGIQVYDGATGPTSDYKSDQIRRSLTLVMLAYYESTGVVLHPFDWEDTELEKDSQGRYVITTNVTVGADQQLWRNPVITTPAMTQGDWLAGAFGLGAKLYDREEANIAISTETRDLFERNAICIRAEERVGLEVSRPEAFVKGTFR
jgi:HK97 family phage major capsid protein